MLFAHVYGSLAMAEIRLILTHMVWRFDLEIAKETGRDWTRQKGWFTWEKKPLFVEVKERKVEN